jgi:hydroxypyruvate reductase
MQQTVSLKESARKIFAEALEAVDAGRALKQAVSIEGNLLRVFESSFNLNRFERIVAVSIGKAGPALAQALSDLLGERLKAGVLAGPVSEVHLPRIWQRFAGGHPVPNYESFAAARAAIEMLTPENVASTLVIFLISGGGSAMFELPRQKSVSLIDLRDANHAFVTCGATIAEINVLRKQLSAVKGGSLSAIVPNAAKLTLIVSDTNDCDEESVASGPSLKPARNPVNGLEVNSILDRYSLREKLPAPVLDALEQEREQFRPAAPGSELAYLLLDNEAVTSAAAESARRRGFVVRKVPNLVEGPIEDGCRQLASQLFELRRSIGNSGQTVCLISGGEFSCPVRGDGKGGRNSEATLRCLLELQTATKHVPDHDLKFAVLNAGTDGIDGNSPAAGAVADENTLTRAANLGLDAHDYLARSDSYSFFQQLNDAIISGPTGTNVRDLRLLLARQT